VEQEAYTANPRTDKLKAVLRYKRKQEKRESERGVTTRKKRREQSGEKTVQKGCFTVGTGGLSSFQKKEENSKTDEEKRKK